MELTPIFEVVKIKQEIREMVEPFAAFQIRKPEDAREWLERLVLVFLLSFLLLQDLLAKWVRLAGCH